MDVVAPCTYWFPVESALDVLPVVGIDPDGRHNVRQEFESCSVAVVLKEAIHSRGGEVTLVQSCAQCERP